MTKMLLHIAAMLVLLVACSGDRHKRGEGTVCRSNDIVGTVEKSFSGKLPGCGISNPVRVSSVAGVNLSQPALMTCKSARAFRNWVSRAVKPAFRSEGGVEELVVAAHYACRTRNSRPGAKLSEHAKGNAIDISGFVLGNGKTVTVLAGWNDRDYLDELRMLHRKACGPFRTVLGPNSDRFHRDHFHFDIANHRGGGTYCR